MPLPCQDTDLFAILSDPIGFGEAGGTVFFKGRAVNGGGIFDEGDAVTTPSDGVAEVVPVCTFTGRTSDFVGIAEGDLLEIRKRKFRVKFWIDEGVGDIEIHMEAM
jgi:hypothetical protein